MLKTWIKTIALLPLLVIVSSAHATLIDYDAGTLSIRGVQIFQDANNENQYYYLPQYPKLAVNDVGEFELLMLKYVGGEEEENGGIFHALIEFSLPDDVRTKVASDLQKLRPGAELVGALPLLEGDSKDAYGGFRVTSAILNDRGEVGGGRVITSGPAPLIESSKAAIAAKLSREEATLLMDSLTGSTADISVSVRGYYLAKVKGYNAVIKANMDTIYEHRSLVDSFQQGYTRRQVFDVADEMIQDGTIDVDVFDQSEGLGIDSESMVKITDLVTEKLIELMFDTSTGWSTKPEPEVAVAEGQIKNRLERGWFQKTFLNAQDTPYYTDDQFVIKKREDIRSNRFVLNLSSATTIRLPFDSTGNLGGFYQSLTESQRDIYFRTISLRDDTDTESREVYFQIGAQTAEGFAENFNSVSVNVRKAVRGDEAVVTRQLIFDPESLGRGETLQSFKLYRLGEASDAWTEFEYQIAWNIPGVDEPLRIPKVNSRWESSRDGLVPLVPPLARTEVEIDADTSDFSAKNIAAAEVQIAATVADKTKFVAKHLIRETDSDTLLSLVFYHQGDEDVAYRVVWHTRMGRKASEFKLLQDGLIFVFAPDAEWFEDDSQ